MKKGIFWVSCPAVTICLLTGAGCSDTQKPRAGAQPPVTTVGVASVTRKPIIRDITLSSELVPFQEIEVFAKESGYVRQLLVDYGTRVKAGQLLAVLEIPELQAQIEQDVAVVRSSGDQVTHAQNELARVEAQHKVSHLAYERLANVAKSRPGLVAQQEVDEAEGRDLALESQVESAKSALENAQSEMEGSKAKEQHDKVIFDYSRITAPFAGVITQRYANLGTLVQAGTSSSTNVLPLVRLSQDDLFRLVIPVPESYVKFVRIGDAVRVRVPSQDRVFPGKVARFSTDVTTETRTMHTEVDVPNPGHVLIPGVYAEATLTLERKNDALVVPLEALNQTGSRPTILLVDPDNRLQERAITLGLETSSTAEVLRGLNEGDRVVVSDRSGLKTGLEVKPQIVEPVEVPGESGQ